MIKSPFNILAIKGKNNKRRKKRKKNADRGFFFIQNLVTFARLLSMVACYAVIMGSTKIEMHESTITIYV